MVQLSLIFINDLFLKEVGKVFSKKKGLIDINYFFSAWQSSSSENVMHSVNHCNGRYKYIYISISMVEVLTHNSRGDVSLGMCYRESE